MQSTVTRTVIGQRRAATLGLVASAGLGLAALVAPGVPTPAEAAVRSCQPARSSGIVSAPTENEGKRRAIMGWMEKVKPLGPRYMGWGTATQRILKCVRGKASQFDCVAVATPCTIEQAPGIPGQKPPGRRRPGDPGRPIDI